MPLGCRPVVPRRLGRSSCVGGRLSHPGRADQAIGVPSLVVYAGCMDERRTDELIAQYRTAWAHVRAAVQAAQPLLDAVEPGEMARILAVLDEQVATDHREVVALLGWYRSVLLVTYRERDRQRGGAAPGEERTVRTAPLTEPFRIGSGQPSERRPSRPDPRP